MKSAKEIAKELGLLRKRTQPTTNEQLQKKARKSMQLFDYIIIIDFESTCWQNDKHRPQEIIEFPAVLLNASSGEIDDEFHVYVQPQENPTLSEFCRQLTGITQEVVDDGLPLSICLRRFNTWLTTLATTKNILYNVTDVTAGKSTCTFATWSDWDLGVCLLYECRRKQLRKPTQLNSWIDLRATYRTFYGRRPHGLNGALQEIGFTFEGREHSGLHDARNTARLAWKMICDGCILNITKTIATSPGTSCALTEATCQPVVPAVSASDMVPADGSSTSKSSPRNVSDGLQTLHTAISGDDTTSDIRRTSSVTSSVTSVVTSVATMCSVADSVTCNKQSPRTVCSKSLDSADSTVTDAAAATSVCGDSCDDLILSEVGFNGSDWLTDDSLLDVSVDGEHTRSKQQDRVQQDRVQQDRVQQDRVQHDSVQHDRVQQDSVQHDRVQQDSCNSLASIQHRRVLKDITNINNNNNNNMSASSVRNSSVSVNQSTVKQSSCVITPCSRSQPLTSNIVVMRQPLVTPRQPLVTSRQPLVTPQQALVTPQQPRQPLVTSRQPLVTPRQPLVTSRQPLVTPRQPLVTPQQAFSSLVKSSVSQPMVTPRGPLNNVLHQSCVLQSTVTPRTSIITCHSTNTSRLPNTTPRGPLNNTLSTNVSQSMTTPRGPLNITCQTSSSMSAMKATAPMCNCGCRAKRKFVQTPGPNSGRSFFCCGLRSTKRCNFFKWELQSSGNQNISNCSLMFNNTSTSSWHSAVCDTPVMSHCSWGNSSRVLVPPSLNYNTPKT